MEFEFLKDLVANDPGISQDLNAPLSYLEWKQTRPQIVETDSIIYYNRYVAEWFENNKNKSLAKKFVLRQKYLYLLDQLQLFFTKEEKNSWYNQINLADEKELLLSIPYFAKRLKQCVLYYLELRNKLKNVKLKYNTKGTKTSLEIELKRAILATFSSLNEELPTSLQPYLPSFQHLQQNLVVEIEEMYDDMQYFDRSSTVPGSAYYDPFHEATSKFFQTKGLVLSTDQWAFTNINLQVSANFNSFFDTLTSNIFDQTDSDLYYTYLSNFLSENKLTLEILPLSSLFETFDLNIESGNNFFYYPYGSVDTSISIQGQIPPISLSALEIEGATAGLSIDKADTIFVKNGNKIQGAWYRLSEFSESQETVRAYIASNFKTSFIFPYPGYGLSGDDFEWTGSSFETDSEYTYLSQEYKAAVDKSYWSQTLTDSSEPVFLNNSTPLLTNGTASTHPLSADKIFLRKRLSEGIDTTTALGELSGAWLYRYSKTSLPVSPGETNTFLWPYQVIDVEEDFPSQFLPSNVFSTSQNFISINGNNNFRSSGFIGTDVFDTSDKIYKLAKHTDGVEDALECAWYYVPPKTSLDGLYKYYSHNNISYYFESGVATKFIWTGANNTPLSSVFNNIKHQPDCPFSSSSYTELSSYTKFHSLSTYAWDKCTCKQVFYTPLGHNGSNFDANNKVADFVVELNTLDIKDEFDLATWRFNGFSYTDPDAKFVWYRSLDSNQKWGHGAWVNYNSNPINFNLINGKEYVYFRATSPYSNEPLSPYIVTKNLSSTQITGTWRQAKKDESGQWVGINRTSTMRISERDIIKIERQTTCSYFYLSSYQVENISENKGSIWSTYDYIALNSPSNFTTIAWPTDGIAPLGSNDPQYPNTAFSDLSAASFEWTITLLSADQTGTLRPTPSAATFNQQIITFSPLIAGFYQISAVAVTPNQTSNATTYNIDQTGFIGGENSPSDQSFVINTSANSLSIVTETRIPFTSIPILSVVPEYKNEIEEIEFTYPVAGFLIEVDLPNPINFWADLFVDKDINTNYKGIISWGYPKIFINDYLPNSLPKFSKLAFEYNTIVDYERTGPAFRWLQPFIFKKVEQTKQWSNLQYNTDNYSILSSVFVSKQHPTLETYPLKTPSSIILSNVLNSSPVEVYYNALNSFVWTVSTEIPQTTEIPEPILLVDSVDAYTKTLLNRFNATVATLPVLEKTYTSKAIGAYLLPQYLGLTQFINKDFVSVLSADNASCYPNTGCPYTTLLSLQDTTTNILTGTFIVEDTNVHIGGRGLTKRDQPTLYTWNEYNQWMKEAPSTGLIAGMPKKSLTRDLQTFIPYKSNNENVSLGLITTQSRVSPWGGKDQEVWTDALNEPKSFTGVRNVSAWSESQILKQNQKQLFNWTTDIFGNQYGLFKTIEEGTDLYSQQTIPGEIWTKTNNGIIQPATTALSAVFNIFSGNTVYSSLTSSVFNIECFFDVLLISTNQLLSLLSLDYDFENNLILTNIDESKFIFVSQNYRYEDVWFFPETKKLYLLMTQLSGTTFLPELKVLDLVDKSLTTQYPLFDQAILFTQAISSVSVEEIYTGKLNYNTLNKTFLLTYNGKTTEQLPFICIIKIQVGEMLTLKEVNFYLAETKEFEDIYPPHISFDQLTKLYYVANGLTNLIQLTAENNPLSYELFNTSTIENSFTTLSVNNSGIFTCTPNEPGLFFLSFKVYNNFGSTSYSIALSSFDGSIVTINNEPIRTISDNIMLII